jgi:hypothetical protein
LLDHRSAGAWQATLDGKNALPVPDIQYHHQPFNYFADMAPGSHAMRDLTNALDLMRR